MSLLRMAAWALKMKVFRFGLGQQEGGDEKAILKEAFTEAI